MDNTTPTNENVSEKYSQYIKWLLFAFVIFLSVYYCYLENDAVNVQHKTYSDLINKQEIAALSISEFVYNGIAQTFKADGTNDYNVLYKSTVKVSVDAETIDFNVDEENKAITFIFTEFKIEPPVIDINSISTIPNKNDLYIDEVINSDFPHRK